MAGFVTVGGGGAFAFSYWLVDHSSPSSSHPAGTEKGRRLEVRRPLHDWGPISDFRSLAQHRCGNISEYYKLYIARGEGAFLGAFEGAGRSRSGNDTQQHWQLGKVGRHAPRLVHREHARGARVAFLFPRVEIDGVANVA
jgi:hypothetical protein